jgi:hypothetical protein
MGAFVPISRVFRVALPTVQVGMDPGRLLPRFVLRNLVSAVKVALGIPPKGLQQRGQACRGHRIALRRTKFLDRHGRILRRCEDLESVHIVHAWPVNGIVMQGLGVV